MTVSIDALAGIAAIDAANEGGSSSAGLYDPKNPATAATAEGLYANRKAAMKAAGVTFGTKAYKDWDAKTRAAMGVKKDDKFSSGQWMETFGGMKPGEINEAAEGNKSFYLDDETFKRDVASIMSGVSVPVAKSNMIQSGLNLDNLPLLGGGQGWINPNTPEGRPLSPWAEPYSPAVPQGGTMSMSPYEAPSFEEYEARFSQSGSKPGQFTRSFLGAGPQDVTSEVMGVLQGLNLSREVERALTVNGLPNMVIDKLEAGVGATYNGHTDTITLGEDWTPGDLVHELGHRAVMHNTPGLENIQMPNVQALFEVGGNALSPGYGSQGEMVSSRAGTAQNLVDSMQYGHFGGQGGSWRDATSFYDKDEWEMDYLGSVTKSRYGKDLPHAAIKAGWSAGTPLAQDQSLYSSQVANPNYSVPGTGNWKGGYENWMARQSEMPNINYGAAIDFDGNAFGPASTTKNWGGGLWNTPMQGAHGLIQEFVLRNKDMLQEGINSPDAQQAMYNKFVAQELGKSPEEKTTTVQGAHGAPHTITSSNVAYAPTSKISLIEKYNLAQEFWEKVGAYWDGFDQYMNANRSPYMGPSQ